MHSVNIYKSFFTNYNLSINDSMYLFLESDNDDKHIFHGLNTVLTPVGINYNQVSKSVYEVEMSVKIRVYKQDQALVKVDATLGNYVYMDAEDHYSFIKQLYLASLPEIYKILVNKLNNNLLKSNLSKINFPSINFRSYYEDAFQFLKQTEEKQKQANTN